MSSAWNRIVMATQRRQQFVRRQTLWMVAILVLLAWTNALTFELFFYASFVGFLVLLLLLKPFNVGPTWHSRLRYLTVLGLVVFLLLTANRIIRSAPIDLF